MITKRKQTKEKQIRSLGNNLADALMDALSVYEQEKAVTVTEERREAWKAALKRWNQN